MNFDIFKHPMNWFVVVFFGIVGMYIVAPVLAHMFVPKS